MFALGLVASGFVALTVGLSWSALPVVLDPRPAVLVLGGIAVGSLWLARRAGTPGFRRLLGQGLILSNGFAVLVTAYDLLAYRTEDVTFQSGAIVLEGTLFLPRGQGPHPAVVLVHGSGRQPRDEYRYYARRYARRGMAALAFDKRGSGASGGDARSASFEDLANDVVAAVTMLRVRPDIDAARVGLWGLSEGEWVTPLAAVRIDPAFLILISPSAMTPSGQVRYETAANVLRAGFPAGAAREADELYALLAEFQRSGRDRDELNRRLQHAQKQPWFQAARYLESGVPDYERVRALDWFPAWHARMDFDALQLLARLKCPVLAQGGGQDPKNDGAAALERIRNALARGGNHAYRGDLYPRAGHGVIEWKLPFGLPPPWFPAGYLHTQVNWAASQVGVNRAQK